jgi:hypothetical protein
VRPEINSARANIYHDAEGFVPLHHAAARSFPVMIDLFDRLQLEGNDSLIFDYVV